MLLQLAIVGCGNTPPPPPVPPPVWPIGSVIPPDGLTEGALSPDGRRFVYSHQPPGTVGTHIFVADLGGANPLQITASPTIDVSASWTPGGKRIIFARATRLRPYSIGGMVWDQWDIWTVNSDGSQEQRLTNEKFYQAGDPHVSPDMRRVLFWAYRMPPKDAQRGQPGGSDIVIGDLDENGNVTTIRWMPISPGPGGSTYFSADNRDASFSPDGRNIVFISNRNGRVEPYDYEVWLTDPAFSRAVQVTHLHYRLNSPTFTRDGQYILFSSYGQFGTASGPSPLSVARKTPLWQIKPDGSDLKQIR